MATIVGSLRAGDRVTIVDRFGKQRTGRAVMRGPHGWVLNMGGRHGTPAIASDENIVKVSPKKGAKRGPLGGAREPRGTIALVIKGPVKSAKRAAARQGISTESCRAVGSGKFGDVQCYAPCTPSTNKKVVEWFSDRPRTKAGRGFPPGTLLYHGEFCSTKRK